MLKDRSAYATIPVADIDRAKQWYEEKLGLTHTREHEGGAEYEVGNGTRFTLYPTGNAGQAHNTLMSFSAGDIEADVRALRERGVVFEEYDFPGLKTENGIAHIGDISAAWFKDSEGNILAISDDLS